MTGDMTTERRCDFCHTEDDNLGELYVHGKYAAHYKCMLYSSGLYQVDESEQDDTFDDFGGGFATGLVIKEIKRGKRLKCGYSGCTKKGATVGCESAWCRHTYHYVCAKKDCGKFKRIYDSESSFSLAFYCKNDINTVEECNSEDSEDESETSSDSENGCDSYDYARTTTTSTIQHHTSKVEIKEEVISDEDNSTHEKDKRNNIVEEDAGDEDNGRHEKDKHNNIIDEDAGDEDNGRHEKDKHNNNIDEDAGDEDNGTHEKDKHNKLVNIIDEDESDESSSHSISIFAESPSTLIEKTVQSGDISPDTVGTSSLETPDKVSSAKSPSTEETPESSYNTVDMMKISRSATFSEARLNTAMPPENTEPSSNAAIICGFCKNGEDIKKYGKLIMHEKDSAHYLCMFNSSGLGLEVSPYSEKFVNFGEGFDANKVRQEMRRGRKLRCRYKECGKTGATVGCEVKHCKATYHYHCAKLDNGHYKFIRDAPNLQYRRTLFCKNHCCESEDESELDSSMSLSQHSLTQQQEHVPWEQSYKQQYDEPQLLNCDPLPDQGSLLPDHGSQLTEYESDLKQLKSQLPDDEILLNNKAQSKDSVPQLSDHHLHLLNHESNLPDHEPQLSDNALQSLDDESELRDNELQLKTHGLQVLNHGYNYSSMGHIHKEDIICKTELYEWSSGTVMDTTKVTHTSCNTAYKQKELVTIKNWIDITTLNDYSVEIHPKLDTIFCSSTIVLKLAVELKPVMSRNENIVLCLVPNENIIKLESYFKVIDEQIISKRLGTVNQLICVFSVNGLPDKTVHGILNTVFPKTSAFHPVKLYSHDNPSHGCVTCIAAYISKEPKTRPVLCADSSKEPKTSHLTCADSSKEPKCTPVTCLVSEVMSVVTKDKEGKRPQRTPHKTATSDNIHMVPTRLCERQCKAKSLSQTVRTGLRRRACDTTTNNDKSRLNKTPAHASFPKKRKVVQPRPDIKDTKFTSVTSLSKQMVDTSLSKQKVDTSLSKMKVVTPLSKQKVVTPLSKQKVDTSTSKLKVDTPLSKQKVDTSPSKLKVDTSPSKQKVVTPLSKQKVDTSPSKQKVDTSPSKQKVDTSLSKQKIDTSPSKQKVVTSLSKQKVDTSPSKQKVDTSPSKQKVDTSPSKQKVISPLSKQKFVTPPSKKKVVTPLSKQKIDTSPSKQKVVTPLSKQKVDTSPSKQKVDTSPSKQKVDTSPSKQKVDTSPSKQKVISPLSKQKFVTPPSKKKVVTSLSKQKVDSHLSKQKIDSHFGKRKIITESSGQPSKRLKTDISHNDSGTPVRKRKNRKVLYTWDEKLFNPDIKI